MNNKARMQDLMRSLVRRACTGADNRLSRDKDKAMPDQKLSLIRDKPMLGLFSRKVTPLLS